LIGTGLFFAIRYRQKKVVPQRKPRVKVMQMNPLNNKKYTKPNLFEQSSKNEMVMEKNTYIEKLQANEKHQTIIDIKPKTRKDFVPTSIMEQGFDNLRKMTNYVFIPPPPPSPPPLPPSPPPSMVVKPDDKHNTLQFYTSNSVRRLSIAPEPGTLKASNSPLNIHSLARRPSMSDAVHGRSIRELQKNMTMSTNPFMDRQRSLSDPPSTTQSAKMTRLPSFVRPSFLLSQPSMSKMSVSPTQVLPPPPPPPPAPLQPTTTSPNTISTIYGKTFVPTTSVRNLVSKFEKK
jgi:hypothetical protein